MKLPDSAQTLIPEANCKPDFLYEESKVAVFCDGSVHDTAQQRQQDRIQRDNLDFNSPYSVFSIRYDQDLSQQLADLASLI
jgi:very-short-patch-repair endonuclease